jgi:hypothetical protein
MVVAIEARNNRQRYPRDAEGAEFHVARFRELA